MSAAGRALHRSLAIAVVACLLCVSPSGASWQDELTSPKPGNFPLPPDLKLRYRFGWAALAAASGDLTFTRRSPDIIQTEGHGSTIGVVRGLWKLDATYSAQINATTLRPIGFTQVEAYRSESKHTESEFTDKEVWRRRYTTPTDPKIPKKKKFPFPYLQDLDSAFFMIRSQRLANGDTYKLVVFPQTTAYLATMTVSKRESLTVRAGNFPAIVCDLKLEEVAPDGKLVPHQKFKRATLWVSDDANRMPLKVESEIFVGSVWLELENEEIKW